MNARTRQEAILQILEKEGYVTVKYLADTLRYSIATINRDLNAMQSRGAVSRSYGGVELPRAEYIPVFFRAHKMRAAKRYIGRVAADFVRDGDTVFIDGSTTAQCMGQYLTGRKDLTVLTNNIVLAANLSGHDIRVICLGGEIVEAPSMLYGRETVENAERYRVDKMFFSTSAVTENGLIASGNYYDLVFDAVAKNAKEIFYLVDSEKVGRPFREIYGDFGKVTCVISDYAFSQSVKSAYPGTRFVAAEVPHGADPENEDRSDI